MRYKYPVRKWLGQYEKWLLTLYGRKTMRNADAELEKFFSRFPAGICVDQFTVTDIAEWENHLKDSNVRERLRQRNLRALDKFFDYLIVDKNLKLYNPVKPYLQAPEKPRPRHQQSPVKLSDFKKLYAAADHSLKEYLLSKVLRERIDKRKPVFQSTKWVANSLRQAKERAGLPDFTMEKLRKAISFGLWRELIKDYAEIFGREFDRVQANNPAAYEAQVPRDLWGNVQFSPVNIWPTVGDDHYRDSQVEWIT